MIEIIFTKSRGTYTNTKYPAVTIENKNKISKNQTSKSLTYLYDEVLGNKCMKIIIGNFCFNMDKNTGWVKQQLT